MKPSRLLRWTMMLAAGAAVMQAGSCSFDFLEVAQTVLLGVTAAGSVALLQNL